VVRRIVPLFFFFTLAWAQTLNCDATEVRFDFAASSGPVQGVAPDGGTYYRASLPAYLAFLDALPSSRRFLPTQVVGASSGLYVTCTVTTPNRGGGGGTLCGAGTTRCLRLSVTGTLPAPLDNNRVYVLGQVVSGNATSHFTGFTNLSTVLAYDGGGLFSVARNTTATLRIWLLVELLGTDAFTGGYSGTLTFTYRLQAD